MSVINRLIQQANLQWETYIEHPFVIQLAQGTLAKSCFQHYLKQDYLYLFQYSRALSLGIFKADNFNQIRAAHRANTALLSEIELHIDFCRQWGISVEELTGLPESPACVAYTRYVLDCGIKGGLSELYAALAPCMLGYAEIGRRLSSREAVESNPYQAWIDIYAGDKFQQAAQEFATMFETLCVDLTEQQLANLERIFTTATRMEIAFWEMGLTLN
ncbi:thiaminase II [Actinobacillus seminis]|uniref:Aminopyrimidine aminohydrolase n=1 Tax=Actinobacillus seminis TaxID=722 RepID=A0A263HFR9_9PAST|nr:thiaminase II [Actinobacillus seminis]OZN25808.1 thiaminase II [Actinobacillus seminis]SUU34710.1 putative transcription activator [Actinobacillus seminis]